MLFYLSWLLAACTRLSEPLENHISCPKVLDCLPDRLPLLRFSIVPGKALLPRPKRKWKLWLRCHYEVSFSGCCNYLVLLGVVLLPCFDEGCLWREEVLFICVVVGSVPPQRKGGVLARWYFGQCLHVRGHMGIDLYACVLWFWCCFDGDENGLRGRESCPLKFKEIGGVPVFVYFKNLHVSMETLRSGRCCTVWLFHFVCAVVGTWL